MAGFYVVIACLNVQNDLLKYYMVWWVLLLYISIDITTLSIILVEIIGSIDFLRKSVKTMRDQGVGRELTESDRGSPYFLL